MSYCQDCKGNHGAAFLHCAECGALIEKNLLIDKLGIRCGCFKKVYRKLKAENKDLNNWLVGAIRAFAYFKTHYEKLGPVSPWLYHFYIAHVFPLTRRAYDKFFDEDPFNLNEDQKNQIIQLSLDMEDFEKAKEIPYIKEVDTGPK